MKSELLQNIMALSKQENAEEYIEKYLEDLLSKDPKNIELWLRLAILEISVPLVDVYKGIKCLNKVVELDKNNSRALLLLAYSYDTWLGGVTEEIFNQLNSIHADSVELNSMFKFIASWKYLHNKDEIQEKKYLEESIHLYSGHVWNYVYLARCYIAEHKYTQAEVLIQRALKNVVKVYTDENLVIADDPTDIDEYINEHIKGIYITDINLKRIKEELSV